MSKAKKVGRGRPEMFSGREKSRICVLLGKHGLTGTAQRLAERKNPILVSVVTLGNLARREGIKLPHGPGRPAKAA